MDVGLGNLACKWSCHVAECAIIYWGSSRSSVLKTTTSFAVYEPSKLHMTHNITPFILAAFGMVKITEFGHTAALTTKATTTVTT